MKRKQKHFKPSAFTTIIGKNTLIRGDIAFSESLHLDGEVHGNILGQGKNSTLTISDQAKIKGDLKVANIIVNGRIDPAGDWDVFCFDAAGDSPGKYFTLGEAIALARSELNVDIELNPLVMRPEAEAGDGAGKADDSAPIIVPQGHAFGTISKNGEQIGRILYVKAGLTGDVPWDVRDYAERNPDFPNQPTFDQLFEDDQFEAYRALGYHLTTMALRDRRDRETEDVSVAVDLSDSSEKPVTSQS